MEPHTIEERRHLDLNVVPRLIAFGDHLAREDEKHARRLGMEANLADRRKDCGANCPCRHAELKVGFTFESGAGLVVRRLWVDKELSRCWLARATQENGPCKLLELRGSRRSHLAPEFIGRRRACDQSQKDTLTWQNCPEAEPFAVLQTERAAHPALDSPVGWKNTG